MTNLRKLCANCGKTLGKHSFVNNRCPKVVNGKRVGRNDGELYGRTKFKPKS